MVSDDPAYDGRGGAMRGRGSPRELAGAALLGLVAVLLGLALVLAMPAGRAASQRAPITIVLSYLIGVSTWGPQNATGVAELAADQGEVHLTATGLAELSGTEQYRLWIVNTTNRDWLSVGAFKAEPVGVAKMDLTRPPFAGTGWDLMLVSVESDGGETPEPSVRRSIAGRFPPPSNPAAMPSTPAATPPGPPAWTVAGLLLGGLIGFVLGRATRRNGPR